MSVLVILGTVWFVFAMVFVLALCLAARETAPPMGSRDGSCGATEAAPQ